MVLNTSCDCIALAAYNADNLSDKLSMNGSDVKRLRIEANMSQSQLAQACGLQQSGVSVIESGLVCFDRWIVQNPGRWKLMRDALNVDDRPIQIYKRSGVYGQQNLVAFVPSGMAGIVPLPENIEIISV